MRYRRRLRSRIIISFALFGFALTALFAAATVYMRTRLEDQLINNTLQRELKNFVDFKRDNPEPDARWTMSVYEAMIVRPNLTPNFSADAYRIKTARWQALWPELTVCPAQPV